MQHLALIMDGNRRWAKQRGMPTWFGHKQGTQTVKMAMQFCIDQHIPYLSLYTFSLENFKRSAEEKEYLFSYISSYAQEYIPMFQEKGVSIRCIGDTSLFPASLVSILRNLEEQTQKGTVLQCNLLFCYGGRQEILAACRAMNALGDFSEASFKKCLWLGDIPDPDLIIRTGGMKRLSNFLLFQAAYAELRFLDCFWPDLTYEELQNVVQETYHVARNIGA